MDAMTVTKKTMMMTMTMMMMHGGNDDDHEDNDDDDAWRPEKARGASGRVSAAATLRTPSYWRNTIVIIIIGDIIFIENFIIIIIDLVNAAIWRRNHINRDRLNSWMPC